MEEQDGKAGTENVETEGVDRQGCETRVGVREKEQVGEPSLTYVGHPAVPNDRGETSERYRDVGYEKIGIFATEKQAVCEYGEINAGKNERVRTEDLSGNVVGRSERCVNSDDDKGYYSGNNLENGRYGVSEIPC